MTVDRQWKRESNRGAYDFDVSRVRSTYVEIVLSCFGEGVAVTCKMQIKDNGNDLH